MQLKSIVTRNRPFAFKTAVLLTLMLLSGSLAHSKDVARSACENDFDSFSDRVALLSENGWVSFDPAQNEPEFEALGYSEFALENDTWTVGAYSADEEQMERSRLMQQYRTDFGVNAGSLEGPAAFKNNKNIPDLIFMKKEGVFLICQIWMGQAPSSSEQAGMFHKTKLGPRGYGVHGIVGLANAEKPSNTYGYLIDRRKFLADYKHRLRYIWKAEVFNIRPN